VQVESLSGGERRRLHLAAVLASTPNVLILDEPTNDLDLSTVEVLEEMLASYRGLLLVVSHDRSFMEGSTDDLLVLPGDGSVQRFQGQYSDYLRQRQQQATAAARYGRCVNSVCVRQPMNAWSLLTTTEITHMNLVCQHGRMPCHT
jgi:ATP-binding cassette subfamily F protein uup